MLRVDHDLLLEDRRVPQTVRRERRERRDERPLLADDPKAFGHDGAVDR